MEKKGISMNLVKKALLVLALLSLSAPALFSIISLPFKAYESVLLNVSYDRKTIAKKIVELASEGKREEAWKLIKNPTQQPEWIRSLTPNTIVSMIAVVCGILIAVLPNHGNNSERERASGLHS